MNIRPLLSIYKQAWYIEPQAGIALLNAFEAMRDKGQPSGPRNEEGNEYRPLQIAGATVAPENSYDMREFKGFEQKVAVIAVKGAMMKEGYYCLGTEQMADLVRMADATEIVETIVLLLDTPGGATDSVAPLAEALQACEKRTVALVSSMAFSAGYFVASYCKEIFCADKMATIGSIGTMCSWWDDTEAMEDKGYKKREFYATHSTNKNRAFREANAGNGKRLVSEVLDPLNEEFMQVVIQNRSIAADSEAIKGGTYYAATAQTMGLVDGVKTLRQIIAETQDQSSSPLSISQTTQNPMMETNNTHPFNLGLTAMQTDALKPVNGGFLVSENDMKNLEAHLKQNNVSALAEQITQMRAEAGDVKALQTENADLKQKLEKAEAETKTLKAENEALGALPGAEPAAVSSGTSDPLPTGSTATYDEMQDPWMKEAAGYFGK